MSRPQGPITELRWLIKTIRSFKNIIDKHAVNYYYTIYKGNNSLISLWPQNAHYRVRKRDTLRHSNLAYRFNLSCMAWFNYGQSVKKHYCVYPDCNTNQNTSENDKFRFTIDTVICFHFGNHYHNLWSRDSTAVTKVLIGYNVGYSFQSEPSLPQPGHARIMWPL